jgi:hypothetical protein
MSGSRSELRRRWRGIIEQQQLSGQGAAEFARGQGICIYQFYRWRSRLGAVPSPAGFVEIKSPSIKSPSDPSGTRVPMIEVCLKGHRRLRVRRGFDPVLLADLLRTLEGMS